MSIRTRPINSHTDIGAQRQAVLDVRDYGAVGDGIADDTAAIQAAINAGGAACVEVFFPNGTYRITDTLDASAIYGAHLVGSGHEGNPADATPAGSQLWMDAANKPILRVWGAAVVRDLCLIYTTQQTTAQTAAIGLQLNNLAGATIERVRVWRAHISFGIPQAAFNATAFNVVYNSSFRDLDSQQAAHTHYDIRNFNGGGTNCTFDRLYVNGGGSLDFVTPGQSCAYALRTASASGYEFGAVSIDGAIVTERLVDVAAGINALTIATIRAEAVTVTKDGDGWFAFGGSDTIVALGAVDLKNCRWQPAAATATYLLRTFATRIGLTVGALRLAADCDFGASGTRRALTNTTPDSGSVIRVGSLVDLKPSLSDALWTDSISTLLQPVREWNGSMVNQERRAGRSGNTHRVFVATAIPTTGTFATDDELLMDIVSAPDPVTAYRCIAGGTPGTWRPIAWVVSRGTTGSRPTLTASDVGVMYLDNTLDADGKPIWWNGTAWVDATGATV